MYLPFGKKYDHYSGVEVPTLSDKIDQYQWIIEIFQQNLDLARAKYDSERIVKKQQLNELRQRIKETKLKLNELKDGEVHVIKNLLKGYKSSIRLGKPLDEMLEHCDCKLFNKRKELDRLNYEIYELNNAYASKQIILNKMQSRQKYSESYQWAKRVKYHTFLLDKSEIEIRNFENSLKDFKSILKYLTNESLRYANTLQLLANEINEQNTLSNLLKKVSISRVKRAKLNENQLQMMKRQMCIEPTTDDNFEVHIPDHYDEKRQSFDGNIDNATRKTRSHAKCANIPTKLHSIVKRIQSKLVTGEEKVNVLKNKFDGMHGKIEKSNHKIDA